MRAIFWPTALVLLFGVFERPVATRAIGAPRLIAVATAESLSVSLQGTSAAGAPTVLLIPGPIGSAFSMRHLTTELSARGIATVVIDPLGMGTSAKPAGADYSLSRQAVRIAAVLDTLMVDRVIIVAQGTSATMALHLAADHPDRVAGIVSLAGGPVDIQGTRAVKLALALAPLLDMPMGRTIGRRKFLAGVREQSASERWCSRDVMRAYLEPFERNVRASLQALHAMSQAAEPTPIATRLPYVLAPVQLLVGDKQSANMPTSSQIALLARSLPVFRVDTVAHSGTMLHEEQPDAVVHAVMQRVEADGIPRHQRARGAR
jgi:pimeloyl-ACP methyl ester carboxylesterase